MFIEKIKFFFEKNTAIKVLINCFICFIAFFLLFYIYRKSYFDISDSTKVVLATILGALIGGGFTLLGSIMINKDIQKANNEIRKMNIIFKPLYDEINVIHNITLEENPYPIYISFEVGPQTELAHPQYTVWGRIKRDSRFFEVPPKLKKRMDSLYEKIETYIEKRNEAINKLNNIYLEEYERITGRKLSNHSNHGSFLLSYILTGERPGDIFLIVNYDSAMKGEADALWEKLQYYSTYDADLKECRKAKEFWIKAEEDVLELLGLYIQYIICKYED